MVTRAERRAGRRQLLALARRKRRARIARGRWHRAAQRERQALLRLIEGAALEWLVLVDDPTLKASLPPPAEVVGWFDNTMRRRLGFGRGEVRVGLRHTVTFDQGSSPDRTVATHWRIGEDGQLQVVKVEEW